MDNISSKYVSNSTGIDFSKSSGITNGQGIYTLSETASESCPVHYFRGNVANNHVIFAGHCWEIVRTTETCGVKLVYNGEPTGGKCLASGSEQNLTKTIFNDSINSLAYQGYMYNKVYEMDFKDMSSISSEIKYGNSFMYSNGSYELTDTITYNSWSDAHNNLNNNHYTCFNSTGTCDSLYYIFYTNSTNAFYVELKDGADIQTALNEMLYASDVNAKDSDIKKYLEDTWFTDKKTGVHYYSRFLEDTKWCNDRQIASLGGWNPNGGSTSETLTFKGYDRLKNTYKPTLKCEEQDAFTLSLDKGGTEGYGNNKLTYPVGMLTADEYVLAGSSTTQTNTDYYLYTSTFVWTLTPSQVLADQYFIRKYNLDSGGGMGVNGISIHEYFIRPSISLIKGTEFESGDGTKENPYVIVVD